MVEIHIRNEHPENMEVDKDAFDTSWGNTTANRFKLFVPVGTEYAYQHHPVFGKLGEVVKEK